MKKSLCRSVWPALLVCSLVTVCLEKTAFGCPNCKEAVSSAQSEEGTSAADGYNWSILFMLAMPFGLMSVGSVMVRRAVKHGSFPEL